ncbi:MAG: peptidase S41 [Bacteroidales bacterium]|nr:peptidase S41 [Bacteroidales bacterium]
MKRRVVLFMTGAMALGLSAATPLWLRNAVISPDGKQIAFTYKGDIYTVPAAGGEATRLTTSESYETSPRWSPDGKKIAFASDRHGNTDIFVMNANGGTPKRLTSNSAGELPEAFSADGKEIYYSAAVQAPTASAMFPTGRMTQLYAVSVDGGKPRQVLGTPAQALAVTGNDGSFLYQDVKGFENAWRKHHTSSVTRDIWRYDAATGTHKNLTDRAGEDRNPVLSPDGKTVYFLSERNGGTFNVWKAPVDDMSKAVQVTNFKTHPVRFLSQAADGTLAFGYDGELYTLRDGGKPQKVAVAINTEEFPEVERIRVTGRGGALSPDGKQVAYASRGEVFVGSVDHSSVKQITNTAAAEEMPQWHPEGREIVYTSLRDGHYNIYSAKIARDDDPNFSNATLIDEAPLIAADKTERTLPKYSPDGKKLAFIQDRNKLMVMDTKTKKVKQLTDGSTYRYRDGGFDYKWSPDNRWIALEVDDNHHSPYTDIAIINVESGEMTHLTRSGYTDRDPHWAMGGNAIVFLTEKYGMRNHASWGSQDDAMIVFLNRDAYDRFHLDEEDFELRKEADKKAAKDKKKDDADKKDKKDKKDADKKDGDKEENDDDDAIVVELDGIMDRVERLTPFSADLAGAWVDNDGENLYYLMSVEKGYDLWKMDLRDPMPSVAVRIDANGASLHPSADGKTLFISGDKMRKIDVGSDKSTSISSSATMTLDHAAEREAMFDEVYLSEREMFYNKNMHGVDWEAMTKAYRRFLPHINNNYDFSEMLSELLGELNVSHTGSGFRGNEANAITDRTARLGLLYDMNYNGKGLKVEEIITGGPFDNAATKLRPGMIITKINGEEIGDDIDPTTVINNLANKKTLVTIKDPASGADFDEVVKPISAGAEGDLLYNRWVKQRAEDVKRWSNGRLGYVHIESMGDDSFRTLYSDLLGKYNECEGAVIDIRWNGGGRLHEDVEVFLSGDKYFTQVIRGEEVCDMPSRRYNKPTVMLMAEPCYSNAHGTPWVYKNRNLGKLVGMPVPGTMTSVNWVTLQDPSLYFGIPVVGYQLPDGSYLENTQLEPDIKVANSPETIVKGEDTQLRTAVEELLKEIDANKKK